ncbi:MAG: GAF domain-containing protein, partial [Bacteroidales bacterium]|nr:GAF domain-containing protein [Bacteroidales bacterium]
MKRILTVATMFLSVAINAQFSNLFIEKITTEHGLSTDNITSIACDRYGFMWFATEFGLCSWDGYEVEVFKAPLNVNFTTINVLQLEADDEDNIWLIDGKGKLGVFNVFDRRFHDFSYKASSEVKLRNISRILYLSSNNKMLIADKGSRALYYFNYKNDSIKKITDFRANVYKMVVYEDKSVLIAADHGRGLDILDSNFVLTRKLLYPDNPLDRLNWVRSVTSDSDGKLWIGSWGKGVVRVNNWGNDYAPPNITVLNKEIPEFIRYMHTDFEGNIWIGTPLGIRIIPDVEINRDKPAVTAICNGANQKDNLNSSVINDIFQDPQGLIWIATRSGGINLIDFNKQKFTPYDQSHFTNMQTSIVHSIVQINPAELLLGVRGDGFSRFNLHTRKNTPYLEDDVFKHLLSGYKKNRKINTVNQFFPFELNGKSYIAFIARYKGVIIAEFTTGYTELLDEVRISNKYFREPFSAEMITPGNLLIGNKLGLTFIGVMDSTKSACDNNNLLRTHLSGKINFSNKNVKSIYCKNSNKVLLGTDAEIMELNDFEIYPDSVSFKTRQILVDTNIQLLSVLAMMEDSKHTLWVGTHGYGLYKKTQSKFEQVSSNMGFAGDIVYSIVEDEFHTLWISTNNGLFSLNLNDETARFKAYTTSDGLQGKVFHHNSYFKNETGQLFFGGYNGFNAFDPVNVRDNNKAPFHKITTIRIFNRSYEEGSKLIWVDTLSSSETLKLTHKDHAIRVRFTSAAYSNSNKNKFAYRLDNFNTDTNKWNVVTPQSRYAYYNNLVPGSYTFKVKSSNCDGVWNNKPATLELRVLPPWWKTLVFKFSLLLIVIIFVVSFYIIRVGQIQRQKRILEIKVQERTREIQQANMELKEQKEEILTQNEEIQQQAEELETQRDALYEQNEQIVNKNKEISKAYQRIEMLSEFGQKLTTALNLESINSMLYNYVGNILDINAFGIGIYLPEEEHILFPSFYEKGRDTRKELKDVSEKTGLTAWCFIEQKSVLINNVVDEIADYLPGEQIPTNSKTALSRIHLPLTVNDKRIGIFIVNSNKANAYAKDDFNNLQTLASYIAIALDNAKAYEQIHAKNLAINESINYAQSIQSAFMPTKQVLDKFFDCFVMFKPKDIVSGDFYWFSPIERDPGKPLKAFMCVADCTGHGVPGALVSMVGNNLLDKYINEKKIENPAQVLEMINVGFQLALQQDQTRNNDGMDMVLVLLEEDSSFEFEVSSPRLDKSESSTKN